MVLSKFDMWFVNIMNLIECAMWNDRICNLKDLIKVWYLICGYCEFDRMCYVKWSYLRFKRFEKFMVLKINFLKNLLSKIKYYDNMFKNCVVFTGRFAHTRVILIWSEQFPDNSAKVGFELEVDVFIAVIEYRTTLIKYSGLMNDKDIICIRVEPYMCNSYFRKYFITNYAMLIL